MQRDEKLIKYSKLLRNKQTKWEDKLWKHLRAGRFYGLKFKRQVVIGKYIIDFSCNSRKLIVESDGFYHKYSITDPARDKYLKGLGYKILRFWDSDIEKDIAGVLEKLKRAAKIKD